MSIGRVMIIDTYYPDVLAHFNRLVMPSLMQPDTVTYYEDLLRWCMAYEFGTADFYSKHLYRMGWDVADVIVNYPTLQQLWLNEYNSKHNTHMGMKDALVLQIQEFKPDVLFFQDLGVIKPLLERFPDLCTDYVIAGQCSCGLRRDLVDCFDVIFTSFPHYLNLSTKFKYNPLAFETSVLDPNPPDRIYDITFVGGVGRPSHWIAGMHMLERVAEAFPNNFKWWGYGLETLDPNSPLRPCHQGYAWGRDMYAIYQRSKVVINRHGEVANKYANNMRLFEATGCGALLLTEARANLDSFFMPGLECIDYRSEPDLIMHISDITNHWNDGQNRFQTIARMGQQRTLKEHTYANRMKYVSQVLANTLQDNPL